jgi:hypothetical protein
MEDRHYLEPPFASPSMPINHVDLKQIIYIHDPFHELARRHPQIEKPRNITEDWRWKLCWSHSQFLPGSLNNISTASIMKREWSTRVLWV